MGVWIEVVKRLLTDVPAMRRIDPTAVTVAVRRSNKELARRLEHSPSFVAEPNQIDVQVFDHVLGHDRIDRIVVPRPRPAAQIPHHINPFGRFEVDVNMPGKTFRSGAEVQAGLSRIRPVVIVGWRPDIASMTVKQAARRFLSLVVAARGQQTGDNCPRCAVARPAIVATATERVCQETLSMEVVSQSRMGRSQSPKHCRIAVVATKFLSERPHEALLARPWFGTYDLDVRVNDAAACPLDAGHDILVRGAGEYDAVLVAKHANLFRQWPTTSVSNLQPQPKNAEWNLGNEFAQLSQRAVVQPFVGVKAQYPGLG